MKRLRILRQVLRHTGASKVWTGFLIQVFLTAAVIRFHEPGITSYRQALWYCYAVVTTIGFGDIVVTRVLSRALSVLLSVSAVVVIALVTGVIVNFFNQINELRHRDTITAFMDQLERLPELSHEELEDISRRVRDFHQNKRFG